MNVSSLISKRLSSPSLTSKTSESIAVVTLWVSVTIMVLALTISLGFRSTISQKIYDFTGAIKISAINPLSVTSVHTPILDKGTINELNSIIAPQELKSVVQAGGVLQSGATNIGVAMIGTQNEDIGDDAIKISRTAARELGVDKGDKVDLVVMGALPMRKQMEVVEVFATEINDMERSIVGVSENMARQVSDVDSASVSYYSIEQPIDNMDALVELCELNSLNIQTAEQQMPQIFDWLDMIDQNMVLVFVIMIIVAIIGIVSSTLIIILEHTPTIATLRAMGMRRSGVQMIFFKYVSRTMLKGVALGLVTGLGLAMVQYFGSVISLDGESYFVDSIPIDINIWAVTVMMAGILLTISVAVAVPTAIISKMKIAQSLKFS